MFVDTEVNKNQREKMTAVMHADPAANCLDYCRVTSLSQTVTNSIHTARRDSTRPSSCVVTGGVNSALVVDLK